MFLQATVQPMAQYGGGPGSGWTHMMDWGGWFHPFGGLGLILAIIALVVVFSIVLRRDRSDRSHRTSNAEEILKERYAKGEISHEEFETMRKNIR